MHGFGGPVQAVLDGALRNVDATGLREKGLTKVRIGFLPGGSCSILETDKSPYTVSVIVLGIGVAVITNISGT